MLTSYAFDPSLNLEKIFQNTPPSIIQIDTLPQLPKDWLTLLENKCREIKPYLEKNIFLKHIGYRSKYKLKTALLEQLSLIYYQISGHLHSELVDHNSSKIILLELMEDIEQCTPGFHIRVNKLVNSFQTPDTLEQFLYLVRKSIVQEIACSLTSSVLAIYQVHVADRVCRIAKKQGLGIEPNIQKDQYKSLLPGRTIRERLENEFPKHYTPLKIPFLLAEQLQLILGLHHYQGASEDYYKSEAAENMVSVIKKIFSLPNIPKMHFKDFFILRLDQFDDPTLFYDINWPLIRQLFFQQLIDESYFVVVPRPANLIDYAYFQALLPEKTDSDLENRFINYYLNNQNYAALMEDLILIKDKFPDYWQKIVKNPIIIENIEIFFKFIKEQPHNVASAKEVLKKLNFTYSLFFSQTKQFILKKIIVEEKASITGINHPLLLKSVKYHPEVSKDLFKLLFDRHSKPYQIFFDLLFKKNSEGSNLLMLAARYDTDTIKLVLNFLDRCIDRIEKEKISELFITQNNNGWNLFSLAARHQSEAMQTIFAFIRKNPYYFDNEVLSIIFNQTINSEWNFLQLLFRYQSEHKVNICLDFLSDKFQLSNNKKWLEIVLNKAHSGGLLRLAAQSNLSALKGILNFISKHIEQLDDRSLHHFFLETSNKGLHIAAYTNSANLKVFLEFIQKHIDRFNATSLCSLFLTQNQTQHNFLHFAVYYQQPDSIEIIFKFLTRNIQFFDKASLQQLFIQKNADGWNFLSAAYLHPASLKIILDFINDNPDIFDDKTIEQIIVQKNKHGYTCLHLATRFQPDSLEIILNFIGQRFDKFPHELKPLFQNPGKLPLFTTLFRKLNSQAKNLLDLSLKYQPESALHISRFLSSYPQRFDVKNSCFKNFIHQKALLTDDHLHIAGLRTK